MRKRSSNAHKILELETKANEELLNLGAPWTLCSLVSTNKRTVPQAEAFMALVLADHKGAIDRQCSDAVFAVWSSTHASAINALAESNGGTARLALGLMSVFEKAHWEAAKALLTPPVAPPRAQTLQQAVEVLRRETPDLEEGTAERALKRPKTRPSPDTTMSVLPHTHAIPRKPPVRKTPSIKCVAALDNDAYSGLGFATVKNVGIRLSSVLAAARQGTTFLGGVQSRRGSCWRYAGGADCLSPVEPHCIEGLSEQFDNDSFANALCHAASELSKTGAPSRGPYGTKVVGAGQYNLVMSVAGGELGLLPPLLRNKQFVVRVPKPSSDALSYHEACSELHNMLTAAQGGFGPRVLWAFVKTVHVARGNQLVDMCWLLVAQERASHTLGHHIHHHPEDAHPLKLLLQTLLDVSARGIVFLDATLNNFMVRELPKASSSAPCVYCSTVTDVLAIDMDPQLYRKLSNDTDPRLPLCFNLLLVGCHMRQHALGSVWRTWRDQKTAGGTLLSLASCLVRALESSDHKLARAVWDDELLAHLKTRKAPGDEFIDVDAKKVLFYYFVSACFREGIAVAGRVRKGEGDFSARSFFNASLGPAMRFFANSMCKRRRVLQVMLDFWTCDLPPLEWGSRHDSTAKLCGDTADGLIMGLVDRVSRTNEQADDSVVFPR